jgi:hypothetical protein
MAEGPAFSRIPKSPASRDLYHPNRTVISAAVSARAVFDTLCDVAALLNRLNAVS